MATKVPFDVVDCNARCGCDGARRQLDFLKAEEAELEPKDSQDYVDDYCVDVGAGETGCKGTCTWKVTMKESPFSTWTITTGCKQP